MPTRRQQRSPAIDSHLVDACPEGPMVGVVPEQGQVIDGQHMDVVAGWPALILQIPYDLCMTKDLVSVDPRLG